LHSIQADVWPPPPNLPPPAAQIDVQHSMSWLSLFCAIGSILLFASGCINLIVSYSSAVLDILNVTDRFVWPIVYAAAAYFAGKALVYARRANRRDLTILGGGLFALNFPLACFILWMSTV